MKGKVIILNAPPNAGKDVIAAAISEATGAEHREFKRHLVEVTTTTFGVDYEWFKDIVSDRDTKDVCPWQLKLNREEFKDLLRAKSVPEDSDDWIHADNPSDTPWVNITPREALIYTSECVYKPEHGSDYFGTATALGIDLEIGAVYSDGGFNEELIPIIGHCGHENVYIVQFTREGADSFEGDSREWLKIPEGVSCLTMINDGTIDEAVDKIMGWIENCDTADHVYKMTTFGDL